MGGSRCVWDAVIDGLGGRLRLLNSDSEFGLGTLRYLADWVTKCLEKRLIFRFRTMYFSVTGWKPLASRYLTSMPPSCIVPRWIFRLEWGCHTLRLSHSPCTSLCFGSSNASSGGVGRHGLQFCWSDVHMSRTGGVLSCRAYTSMWEFQMDVCVELFMNQNRVQQCGSTAERIAAEPVSNFISIFAARECQSALQHLAEAFREDYAVQYAINIRVRSH